MDKKKFIPDPQIEEIFGKEKEGPLHTEPQFNWLGKLPHESQEAYERRKRETERLRDVQLKPNQSIDEEGEIIKGANIDASWIDDFFTDKQSKMEEINIDWIKIYEVNPKGLLEWIPIMEWPALEEKPKTLKCQIVEDSFICDFGQDYPLLRSYPIYFKRLNDKADSLINWFDDKGIYLVPDIDIDSSPDIDSWNWDIKRYGHLDESSTDWYNSRPKALSAGILKAFELLKEKG